MHELDQLVFQLEAIGQQFPEFGELRAQQRGLRLGSTHRAAMFVERERRVRRLLDVWVQCVQELDTAQVERFGFRLELLNTSKWLAEM